jgi:superfamily II DNA or RNA helicase
MHLLIRRYGNLIDVSADGRQPTSSNVVDLLSPALTYVYRQILRGAEAYDPVTGARNRVRLETRRLWQISADGKFTCAAGHIQEVADRLRAAGYTPHYIDISPPRTRPNCYEQNWENMHRYIQFRARQLECVMSVVNNPGGIINAVTGFGKTTMIGATALLYPKARIDVVVRSLDIGARIMRSLSRIIPDVGQVCGTKRRWRRVTVVSADSLHRSDGDADFLFGDECHQLVAPSYCEPLANLYRFSRNYGFSATPYGRKDGTQARLAGLFGPQIFLLTYPEAVALGLVVPIRVHWLDMTMAQNPVQGKTNDITRQRWGIWRNEHRNRKFAEFVQQNYTPNTQVVFQVATVEHAVYLQHLIPEAELAYGEPLAAADLQRYVGNGLLPASFPEMTPQRREHLRNAFEAGTLKRAIATDVWSTGVDFCELQVAARMDARDSEIMAAQGPGRTSRIHTFADGTVKDCGEVIDSTDVFDKSFRSSARGRFRDYDKMGWAQTWPRGSILLPNAQDIYERD